MGQGNTRAEEEKNVQDFQNILAFFYGVYTPLDKDQTVTLLTQYVYYCMCVCVLERG